MGVASVNTHLPNYIDHDMSPDKVAKRESVEWLVKHLMEEHGIDYTFYWNDISGQYGSCYPLLGIIKLNVYHVYVNTLNRTEETILHEIAHALNWKRNKALGHGEDWREICIEIGAPPRIRYSVFDTRIPYEYQHLMREDNCEKDYFTN